MSEKLKYFIVNKSYDFSRGIGEKLEPSGGSLRFCCPGASSGVARYLTRIFDCGESGMEWHRLTVRAPGCSPEDMRITVFASDGGEFRRGGTVYTPEGVFEDASLPLQQKLELFEPFVRKRIANASDVLLHGICGRYIWFLIEMYSRSDAPAELEEIRIYLPAVSWIDRLPQLYRRSDADGHFLERYLAIFQTVSDELNDTIAASAYYFDPECAEHSFLCRLAEWIDIRDSWLWEEEKLRQFLMRAVSLYRRRGTKESLAELITLYTGERPLIVEDFELTRHAGTALYEHTLRPLYGDDPYRITVLLRADTVRSEQEYAALQRIAAEMVPASFEVKLILLEPYIFLGRFSYLGINSALGSYRPAAFDGRATMMLSAIGADGARDTAEG